MDKYGELGEDFGVRSSPSGPGISENGHAQMTESARMTTIVEKTVQSLIDVSRGTDYLEVDQAIQRQNEIINTMTHFSPKDLEIQLPQHDAIPMGCDPEAVTQDPNSIPSDVLQFMETIHEQAQEHLEAICTIRVPSQPLIAHLANAKE